MVEPDSGRAHTGVLLVRSRKAPGLSAQEMEAWYLERHFPDVLADPAIRAAELYSELGGTRVGADGDGASGGEYLAVYAVAGDPHEVTARLRARMLEEAGQLGLPEGYEFVERVAYRRVTPP